MSKVRIIGELDYFIAHTKNGRMILEVDRDKWESLDEAGRRQLLLDGELKCDVVPHVLGAIKSYKEDV